MHINSKILLCRYHYDSLDHLASSKPAVQADTQRFYQKRRLTTEIQGVVQHSIMQHDDELLTQQQHLSGTVQTNLLATDQQCSVMKVLDGIKPDAFVYTPYGHRSPEMAWSASSVSTANGQTR
ncbi:hypothetical protein [Pseudomonas sp. Irchel s3b6]|uniref:hypothetical protein n=1 Tax=unclassified Pseudomonas TaxID=196821 RepID=UPI00353090E2